MDLLPFPRTKLAIYLINMADAHERRETMLSRLSALGLAPDRIHAVDGRALSFPMPEFSERSYKLLHGRRTCPPEIGCYLSHVECARSLLDSEAEFALVLEDDIVFEKDFLDSLSAALHQSGSWDILRLSTVNDGRKFPFKRLTHSRSLAISLTREKGAGAYVINRKAAQWIVTDLMPMRLAYDIAFDTEYLAGLKAAFIFPLCTTQNADGGSQIQRNMRKFRLPGWRYFTVLPYRAYLETARFLLRSAHLLILKIRYRNETLGERNVSEASLVTPTPELVHTMFSDHAVVSPGVKPIR